MAREKNSPKEPPPSEEAKAELRRLEDSFIENWGDIGGLWGVNRSIGRIHALLFLSKEPVSMEDISQRLQISHGNASTSIRDLLAWGVIRRVHLPGERRAFYEAEQDPWTWFHTCIRERRRREVLPVFEKIGESRKEARRLAAQEENPEFDHLRERIDSFSNFMDEFLTLIDAFLAVGHGPLGKAMLTMSKLLPKGREAK